MICFMPVKWRKYNVETANKNLWEESVLEYITKNLQTKKRGKFNAFGGGMLVDIRYTYEMVQRLQQIPMFQNNIHIQQFQ